MKKKLQWTVMFDGEIVRTIDKQLSDRDVYEIFDDYKDAVKCAIEILEEDKEESIQIIANVREDIYELDAKIKELKLELE